jgi:hypothetical protein
LVACASAHHQILRDEVLVLVQEVVSTARQAAGPELHAGIEVVAGLRLDLHVRDQIAGRGRT